jgi:hypothetical protein
MPAGLVVVLAAVDDGEPVEGVEGEIDLLHRHRARRAALEDAAESVEVIVIGVVDVGGIRDAAEVRDERRAIVGGVVGIAELDVGRQSLDGLDGLGGAAEVVVRILGDGCGLAIAGAVRIGAGELPLTTQLVNTGIVSPEFGTKLNNSAAHL